MWEVRQERFLSANEPGLGRPCFVRLSETRLRGSDVSLRVRRVFATGKAEFRARMAGDICIKGPRVRVSRLTLLSSICRSFAGQSHHTSTGERQRVILAQKRPTRASTSVAGRERKSRNSLVDLGTAPNPGKLRFLIRNRVRRHDVAPASNAASSIRLTIDRVLSRRIAQQTRLPPFQFRQE